MAMPALPFVTAFYAALTGFLCVLLSALVIRQRFRRRVSIGDGGDAEMSRISRVFGNFAEYAALVLILLALLEICGGSRVLVHALGIAFVLSRVAHAFGLARTTDVNPGRAAGIITTLLVILVASIALLVIVGRKILG